MTAERAPVVCDRLWQAIAAASLVALVLAPALLVTAGLGQVGLAAVGIALWVPVLGLLAWGLVRIARTGVEVRTDVVAVRRVVHTVEVPRGEVRGLRWDQGMSFADAHGRLMLRRREGPDVACPVLYDLNSIAVGQSMWRRRAEGIRAQLQAALSGDDAPGP